MSYLQFSRLMNYLLDPLLLAIRLFWGFKILRAGMVKLVDIETCVEQFSSMGVGAPWLVAILIGAIEAVGGFGLMIGFGTQLWALLIGIIMGSAYFFEHPEALAGFSTLPLVDALDLFMKPYHFLFLFPMVILLAAGSGRMALEWLWFRKNITPLAKVPKHI